VVFIEVNLRHADSPRRIDEKGTRRSTTQLGHVLRGGAFLTLHDVELDALAFGEGLEAATLDRGVVDEAILLSLFRRDEAEGLRIVEPLDGAGRTHVLLLDLCGVDPAAWTRKGPARNSAGPKYLRNLSTRTARVSLAIKASRAVPGAQRRQSRAG